MDFIILSMGSTKQNYYSSIDGGDIHVNDNDLIRIIDIKLFEVGFSLNSGYN